MSEWVVCWIYVGGKADYYYLNYNVCVCDDDVYIFILNALSSPPNPSTQ